MHMVAAARRSLNNRDMPVARANRLHRQCPKNCKRLEKTSAPKLVMCRMGARESEVFAANMRDKNVFCRRYLWPDFFPEQNNDSKLN